MKLLLSIASIRIAASGLDIKSIVSHGGNLVFSFAGDAAKHAKRLFKNTAARYTAADETTAYLHLAAIYFEPATMISFLQKMLGRGR
jgi:hypothetical protein